MKVHLLFPDRDFDAAAPLPPEAETLAADLGLETPVAAMAAGDGLIAEVARAVLLGSTEADVGLVRFRQGILADCLDNPRVVKDIYALAGEALDAERKQGWHWADSPSSILGRSRSLLSTFMELLGRIKALADRHGERFHSAGFRGLFAMLDRELDAAYFAEVEAELSRLQFNEGVLISASLGAGNHGVGHVLRRWPKEKSFLEYLTGRQAPSLHFEIAPRDEAGWKAREQLEARGLNLVANAVAQSADHVASFFSMLRTELAFYLGGLNLRDALAERGLPFCLPAPAAADALRLAATGLYDIGLGLGTDGRVVASDIEADGRRFIVVTGANRGGKTTFLRGLGLAFLMMQAGLMAPAAAFSASLADRLLSHFRKEEDATMRSGKLDEELARMDGLVRAATHRSLFLFNESFAATNEREGSKIAGEITGALIERGVRVAFVTHLYTFAHAMLAEHGGDGLFLRAERPADDGRVFPLERAEPLDTSFGRELFAAVMGE
ncbi:putative DNA mismatch repair protein [uncultured Pleomorphomonas sp.]|uniref:Putative DNA mismatch repair protein n=1 Tax=uncultured Pleomorphomonas sp. TaxID=442121 RepID=A0A212LPP7_9HYPH|nr:DNA mismatch repair protein MutS [uncultured Pleomorphomonas sp.]SCM79533.1 putative DNA mismatch repair protein [uncultured Pleomorphomonas sp.]